MALNLNYGGGFQIRLGDSRATAVLLFFGARIQHPYPYSLDVMSCLIDLITWISNFKQEIKSNQHWAL